MADECTDVATIEQMFLCTQLLITNLKFAKNL